MVGTTAGVVRRLRGVTSGENARNSLIFLDTAVAALTGLILLVGAGRALPAAQLATFSLAQLVITLMVTLLRSAVYGPAMAAQRTTGRATISASWLFRVSLPAVVLPTALIVLFVGTDDRAAWLLWGGLAAGAYIGLDGLRSILFSRNTVGAALGADLVTLAVLAGATFAHLLPASATGLLRFWAGATGPAILICAAAVVVRRPTLGNTQSLREAWRLGRWSAAETLLAVTAYLLPMFVTTVSLGATTAGTYRVLQGAHGPLNIMITTVLTVLGLDSWRTATQAGLDELDRRVRRIFVTMVIVAVGCLGVVIPGMAWLTHLSGDDLVRIGVIVGLAGLFNALTTPFNGASLSLGYQRYGAMIRVVVLVLAVLISLPFAQADWLPWHDPIGVAMLTSAAVPLLGWFIAYHEALRTERRFVEAPPGSRASIVAAQRGRRSPQGSDVEHPSP